MSDKIVVSFPLAEHRTARTVVRISGRCNERTWPSVLIILIHDPLHDIVDGQRQFKQYLILRNGLVRDMIMLTRDYRRFHRVGHPPGRHNGRKGRLLYIYNNVPCFCDQYMIFRDRLLNSPSKKLWI